MRRGAVLLAACLIHSLVSAQQPDSLARAYRLGEVVIAAEDSAEADGTTLHRLASARLAPFAPSSVADIVRLVPAAHLQVNSRGEALVYLRGAPERQVALFLDGVPLNVPWDARFDLSLLPAFLLGRVEVATGPFSVLYGPNSAGGVVDFRTKSLERPGRLVEVALTGGIPRRAEGGLLVHHFDGRRRLDVGVVAASRQGEALPSSASVPFSQPDTDLRTNTDRAQVGVLLRAGTLIDARTRLSTTAFFADAEKGVAPESHLDPATDAVRYWRYPRIRLGTLSVAAERDASRNTLLRAQVWTSGFAQHIDQYETVAYRVRTASQRDGDYTQGLRLSSRFAARAFTLRSALLLTTSLHRQRDNEPENAGPVQRYRQHVLGIGVDASGALTAETQWRLGLGLDGQATPVTGDKPAYPSRIAWTGSTGIVWKANSMMHLRVGAARKTRFPTPRELFGTALNRFLLNDQLRPESIWSGEVAAGWRGDPYHAEVVLFAQRTKDAIDQRSVLVDGKSLRQRVNLDGSLVRGVEFSGVVQQAERLRFEGHLAVLRARGHEGRSWIPLAEKPALTALLVTEVRLWKAMRIVVDLNRIAGAFGVEEEGVRPRLPGVWLVGGRISRTMTLPRGTLMMFGRVDNALDATLLPQQGLPAAGRTFVAGLTLQV